jgi:Flp pilus assembly protein TadG
MARACRVTVANSPPLWLRIVARLRQSRVCSNQLGSAAIEFAFLAPVFFLFLLGIVCYGSYFYMAHSLQQLANDAARSAVAGLTGSERQSLAQNTFNNEITNYSILNPALATVSYQGTQNEFQINISYNAASTPFWAAASLLPMPSTTIVRTAAVQLGGF